MSDRVDQLEPGVPLHPGGDLPQFEVAKLDIQPGDVLLVKCRYRLSMAQHDIIKQSVESVVGSGAKVLVADDAVDLTVIHNSAGDTIKELERRLDAVEEDVNRLYRNDGT